MVLILVVVELVFSEVRVLGDGLSEVDIGDLSLGFGVLSGLGQCLGISRGSRVHGTCGVCWVFLTFPHYQCNELSIFVRKDQGVLSVREIMYSDVIVELYIHVGSRLGRRDDAISIYSSYNDMCLSI